MDALKIKTHRCVEDSLHEGCKSSSEIIENDPVDMNAVETAFEQLKNRYQTIREQLRKDLELSTRANWREQTQRHQEIKDP
ncbi:hypothetical protein TNIN_189291 [Trichonephila inaurata madagascariensis]|uniref:Uncharacterized protein n=1 Tax=Trichonephila inaurata madagascariensis TaxID=2747483 RepID=A0A8X6XGN6_9ARAC|nr:hypothetical protein TNIN_189291 [Trichonephila inaurata madagascariensis]